MNTKILLRRPVHVSHEARLEKEAVRLLLTYERFARDSNLWDDMRTCYLDDSIVESSWFKGTGPEYIEALSKRPNRAPHHVHSTLVWMHGNRAVSIMETTLKGRHDIDGVPVDLTADAQILYRLKRINGEWYIAGWTTIYEQDNLTTNSPTDKVKLDLDEIAKNRTACQCLAYIQKRNGKTIYEDLPGFDRPETIEKLYEEADRWLLHG